MKQKSWILKIGFLLFTLLIAFSVYGAILNNSAIQSYNLTALVLLILGPIILLVISFVRAFK